jgi:hypothetical protein
MILENDIREKFESWAAKQGHNLTRHPNNEDFYYNRDVSSLWVCFSTAYMMGQEDNSNFIKDLLDMELEDFSIPTAQTVLIERTVALDE